MTTPPDTTTVNWAIGANEERFYDSGYATKEDAIAAAPGELDLEPGATFCVGRAVPFVPRSPSAESLVDALREQAYEAVGDDLSEGWLNATTADQDRDLEAKVSAAIAAWLAEHKLTPTFYCVEDVEEHSAP